MKAPEPSVGTVLRSIWSHKLVMIFSVIIMTGLATGAYLLITPVFEASSSVLVSVGADGPEKTGRQTEFVNSQVRVAESLEVIRDAINRVGVARLDVSTPSVMDGLGGRFRQIVYGAPNVATAPVSDMDIMTARISRAVTVRSEPNSEVIRIAFKNNNQVLAADFANALTSAFIERQLKLSDKPGIVDFFRTQRAQFDAVVQRSAAEVENFAEKEAIYSIEEQRGLLLKRASELAGALGASRSSLAEKQGQKASLAAQLKLLKPVTQSAYVSGLVDNLGGEPRPGMNSPSDRLLGGGDPPLLMVRVYQDSMVTLFKVNSEIAGIEDMIAQQTKETARISTDLTTLAGKEAEFERLRRQLNLAVYNADNYAKRAVEEQINADLRLAKLTNVRVIQKATVPVRAAFPNGIQFLAFGGLAGLIVGTAIALLLDARKMREPEFVDLVATSAWLSNPPPAKRIHEVS